MSHEAAKFKRLLPWIEGALSAGLMAWAASMVPWRDMRFPSWSLASGLWALVSVAGASSATAFYEAWRLQLAARGLQENKQVPLLQMMALQLRSRPWAILMPGSLASDGYLALIFPDHMVRGKVMVRALLAQRAWGLAGWCAAMAGLLGFRVHLFNGTGGLGIWMHPSIWAIGAASCLAGGQLLWPGRMPWRLILVSLGSPLASAPWLAAADYAAGTGLGLPFMIGFQALMMVGIALPISLGGLGLQEYLLLRLSPGPPEQTARLLAFSLLLHLHRLVPAAAGAALSLRGRTATRG